MLVNNPLVSVSIITYNQRDFIGKAIDSVLKQEVAFPYEIIIGDDCSNDGTVEVLREYQARYPDKIQLILHPRRYDGVPGRVNNITNLYACRGKYIAMLDGDDYWISTNKLQKQVNFLEENPAYAMAFHDTLFFCDDDRFRPYFQSKTHQRLEPQASYTYQDIAEGWFIQTSTMMFRNGLIGEFPNWFWEVYSADYAIQLLIAQHGSIKYLEEIKAARRMSDTSFSAVYNTTLADNSLRIKELKIFNKHLPEFSAREGLAKFYFRRGLIYKKKRRYWRMLYYVLKSSLMDRKIAGSLLQQFVNRFQSHSRSARLALKEEV